MNTPIHPGVWLKSRLGVTRPGARLSKNFGVLTRTAERLGYSVTGLDKILNGQRRMTYRMAFKIEEELGYSAERLLRMQFRYDLAEKK